MLGRILIVDEMHPVFMDALQSHFLLDYKPGLSYTEVLEIISDYDILTVRTGIYVDAKLMEVGHQLKIIARAGAGLDNIDEQAAVARGIVCINAPEGNRDAVAEQTIGMLLALLHQVVKGDREVRQYRWDRESNRGTELGSKTVGIIGYGNTGEAVANRLTSFRCKILAYDLYRKNFGNQHVKEATLEQIFEEADILSLHIPLTDLTLRWINYNFIQNFRKPVCLLNLSRGKIMVIRELLRALDEGKILGLATDVLENENLHGLSTEQSTDFEELISRDNVIITPHVGGWTRESYIKISEILSVKILNAFIEGSQNENNFIKHIKTPR